jgi:hypothetical protein
VQKCRSYFDTVASGCFTVTLHKEQGRTKALLMDVIRQGFGGKSLPYYVSPLVTTSWRVIGLRMEGTAFGIGG